jgi:hypothetical protein
LAFGGATSNSEPAKYILKDILMIIFAFGKSSLVATQTL